MCFSHVFYTHCIYAVIDTSIKELGKIVVMTYVGPWYLVFVLWKMFFIPQNLFHPKAKQADKYWRCSNLQIHSFSYTWLHMVTFLEIKLLFRTLMLQLLLTSSIKTLPSLTSPTIFIYFSRFSPIFFQLLESKKNKAKQ